MNIRKRDMAKAKVGMRTGVEIRDELRTILEARLNDLVTELASYAIRIRNETLRACEDEARLRIHEMKDVLNGALDGAFPVLKANLNILPSRKVAHGVKSLAPIKGTRKRIPKLNARGCVIKGKNKVTPAAVSGDKAANVSLRNNLNLHKTERKSR